MPVEGTGGTNCKPAPGKYKAAPVESVYLPNQITGADINANGDLLALCSYGRIYAFRLSADSPFFKRSHKMIHFTRGAQMEGLAFIGDTDFIISNETGNLFLFKKN